MVLARITRILRGWLSMYKEEAREHLEGMIVKLEELSRRPAQIEWREEVSMASSSQLVPLGAQSLVDARNDSFVAESYNEQFDQTTSTCLSYA